MLPGIHYLPVYWSHLISCCDMPWIHGILVCSPYFSCTGFFYFPCFDMLGIHRMLNCSQYFQYTGLINVFLFGNAL